MLLLLQGGNGRQSVVARGGPQLHADDARRGGGIVGHMPAVSGGSQKILYALVGVEITTNYSFVVLLKNKESDTIRDAIKEIRRQLKTANNSDVTGTVDLVRLHSDDDASF